jgi:hypothetical protein
MGTDITAVPDELIAITLRQDEVDYLSSDGAPRCDCGHLVALHNYHCCTFCLVDGCPCGD